MRYMLFAYAMGFAVIGAMASFLSAGKDNYLSDALFRDLMDGMGRELTDAADNYLDLTPIAARSRLHMKQYGNDEQMFPVDYDIFGDANLNPSIRDQEYLEHSSLWGNQYVSGGAGEGQQRLKPEGSIKNQQEVKTDASLPAYCNPPNPCPIGFNEQQGCSDSRDFENTAAFSRRYQAAQDCMCDTEHMFECPIQESDIRRGDSMADALDEMDFNRFLQHSMQLNERTHKNLVAKKYHNEKEQQNPYLFGERLPVAAKKGTNVNF